MDPETKRELIQEVAARVEERVAGELEVICERVLTKTFEEAVKRTEKRANDLLDELLEVASRLERGCRSVKHRPSVQGYTVNASGKLTEEKAGIIYQDRRVFFTFQSRPVDIQLGVTNPRRLVNRFRLILVLYNESEFFLSQEGNGSLSFIGARCPSSFIVLGARGDRGTFNVPDMMKTHYEFSLTKNVLDVVVGKEREPASGPDRSALAGQNQE
jgi:hypothetical protein